MPTFVEFEGKLRYCQLKWPNIWKLVGVANLEEAELVGRLVRPDDQCLHVTDVDITARDGKRCKIV